MSNALKFNEVKKEFEWCGRTVTFETGKVARQADGAILVKCGGAVILCTAVAQKAPKEGIDFFPLTIHYQEKYSAAGKIPGGFFKREARPTENETLTSRLIDRPIRPLFPNGFRNETQVICTVMSFDPEVNTDVLAMIGASAALSISGIPFQGPIAGIRVAYIDGNYVANPTPSELAESSELDLVLAGTESSVLMVESEANVLSEEVMLGAVEFGHKEMQTVIKAIADLAKKAGKPVWDVEELDTKAAKKRTAELAEKEIRAAYAEKDKQKRVEKLTAARDTAVATLTEEFGEEFDDVTIGGFMKSLEKDVVRGDLLKTSKRIDGRGLADVRGVDVDVSFLPKTHGSALFTRGETQSVGVTTLGTGQDMQIIDSIHGDRKEHFLLHYNFPPYSVGEAYMMRAPGRREIGHGRLAWRALKAVMPSLEDFPYTIRVLSEVTESNGSSSMATVCSGALSMMDAGVPLKASVAGIAMGLILEGKDYCVLSDILGDEDHLGDMDFKVAGTSEGVTALQMDIKINGITTAIMKEALAQAKEGRLTILEAMNKTLSAPRKELNDNAPQIRTVNVDKEKIGAIIGPGGKMIREICETSGAKIDIEEDGTVLVSAVGSEAIEKAVEMIKEITTEPEVGAVYDAKVIKMLDFGAVVSFLGKSEGLVHISEIKNERVEDINSVLKLDDEVKVVIVSVERGKARLSMRRVDQKTGEAIPLPEGEEDRPPRRRNDRNDRRGGRGGRDNRRDDRKSRNRDEDDNRGNRNDDDNRGNSDDDKPKKKKFF